MPLAKQPKNIPWVPSTTSLNSFQESPNGVLRKPIPDMPLDAYPGSLPPGLVNTTSQNSNYPPPPTRSSRGSQSSSLSISPTKSNRSDNQPQNRLRQRSPPRMIQEVEEKKDKKSKGWLRGLSKRKRSLNKYPGAWIFTPGQSDQESRTPFNIDNMMAGVQVPELWDDSADCLVYLFPKSSGKGPSFKIDPRIFASSDYLRSKAFGGVNNNSPVMEETPDTIHLYLDLEFNGKPAPQTDKKDPNVILSDDAETVVGIRNLFGFLFGQSLVATNKRDKDWQIFLQIADLLAKYGFTNMDGSTFGEVAANSFENYINELELGNVRNSIDKIFNMLVLGERMRSVTLYTEAFTHAVGNHNSIQKLMVWQDFQQKSTLTAQRLGRESMLLDKRVAQVSELLKEFKFRSIFSGIVNSKTIDERRLVNFDGIRLSYTKMRAFYLGHCKERYGHWPPRADQKGNKGRPAGLHRLVLREVFDDLCDIYDLLVDRTNLTNRTADGVDIEERSADPPMIRMLRHILSEYDRSTPPVKPPIPFDLPRLPQLAPRDRSRPDIKVKGEQLTQTLRGSYNMDFAKSDIVQKFMVWEWHEGKNRTIGDLADLRCGIWIFMYAVMQALPLLVVDAPGVNNTDGVTYFLCQASRGGVPWSSRTAGSTNQYYKVDNGGAVVSLPADVIEHSIDGVYRRSHCWQMAEKWSANDPLLAATVQEQAQTYANDGNIPPPPAAMPENYAPGFRETSRYPSASMPDLLGPPPMMPVAASERVGQRIDSRSSSPNRKRESVLNLGLSALNLPSNSMTPTGRAVSMHGEYMSVGGGSTYGGSMRSVSRPVSVHTSDPNKTFDSILGSPDTGSKRKGR